MAPADVMGSLVGQGVTWLPRFGQQRKAQAALQQGPDHSKDVALAQCLSDGRQSQQENASDLQQPGLQHGGAVLVKGDQWLAKNEQTALCLTLVM